MGTPRIVAIACALGACREAPPVTAAAPRVAAVRPCASLPGPRVLSAPAYDVAVTPAGTYVVALGAGVQELDPCTLDGLAGCQDLAEARAMVLRADGLVVSYRHREGGVVACDLRTGQVGAAEPHAREELERSPHAEDGPLAAVVDLGAAALRGGVRAMPLHTYDEAVDVDVDARRSLAAVCDRSGAVTLWSAQDGRALIRWPGKRGVACAIALDRARGRLVRACADGRVEVRALPPG